LATLVARAAHVGGHLIEAGTGGAVRFNDWPISCSALFVETTIEDEISAFEEIRRDLEAEHMGNWVLIHRRKLVAVFDTFEEVAKAAVAKFGRGRYLIRQVGAPPVVLPPSTNVTPAPHKGGAMHG
jgi:hypothetical protein